MTVYVPRSNRVPQILALMQRPQLYCCAWGKFSLSKRNCRITKAVTWPGVFLLKIFGLLWYMEVTSRVWGMQKSHFVSASHWSTSATPALEQQRWENEGFGSILCYITISRPAWATEDPVWKDHFKPNQNQMKSQLSLCAVISFQGSGKLTPLHLVTPGDAGRGSCCSPCFMLKN